jgi:hypothetical protein
MPLGSISSRNMENNLSLLLLQIHKLGQTSALYNPHVET